MCRQLPLPRILEGRYYRFVKKDSEVKFKNLRSPICDIISIDEKNKKKTKIETIKNIYLAIINLLG